MLDDAAHADFLSPSQAGKLRGVLGFTLLPVMMRVGRAACQALVERQYRDRPPYTWTAPLQFMRSFSGRVLDRLPPLRVPMEANREVPLLVYTDASFHTVRRHGRRRRIARLGIYVYDPVSGREFWAKRVLPDEYYSRLSPDKKTYIAQAELITALAAYWSFPELLSGRAVMHFIDNMTALSALVNGYASKSDCAAMVNAFHERMLEMRCRVWAEWVPSEANIADWPTRPDKEHLVPISAEQVPPVLLEADRLADPSVL